MAEFLETFWEICEKIDSDKMEHFMEVLKDLESNKKSCLTLVISPSEEISHAIDRVQGWIKYPIIENSQSYYKDAIEAITSAVKILKTYSKVPDNGLIIYTGIVYTDDGKKDVAIAFEPFKMIYDTCNTIQDKFDITPITKLLETEHKPFGGIFFDSNIIPSTQSIRRGKEEAKPVVNPQSFAYFSFLSTVGGIITFQLGAVRLVLRQNPSLFKDHGGGFTIMIIVSGFMAVLSSFVLVLSSFLLKHWMKEIHYTILKTIGSFSAILVPFYLGAAVFVPSGDLNWIAYTVLFVIFGGLLYLYSFIWKVACAYHHQNNSYNSYPVHWAYLLIILVPLTISLLLFFSSSLRWLAGVFVVAFLLYCLRLLPSRGSTEKTLLPSRGSTEKTKVFNRKDKAFISYYDV